MHLKFDAVSAKAKGKKRAFLHNARDEIYNITHPTAGG